MIDTATLDPHAARIVLDVLGEGDYGGYASGSMRALAIAAAHLDPDNLYRLSLGFPELAAAIKVCVYEPDGIARLRQAASS